MSLDFSGDGKNAIRSGATGIANAIMKAGGGAENAGKLFKGAGNGVRFNEKTARGKMERLPAV